MFLGLPPLLLGFTILFGLRKYVEVFAGRAVGDTWKSWKMDSITDLVGQYITSKAGEELCWRGEGTMVLLFGDEKERKTSLCCSRYAYASKMAINRLSAAMKVSEKI